MRSFAREIDAVDGGVRAGPGYALRSVGRLTARGGRPEAPSARAMRADRLAKRVLRNPRRGNGPGSQPWAEPRLRVTGDPPRERQTAAAAGAAVECRPLRQQRLEAGSREDRVGCRSPLIEI
jgi:hypothetical protein